MQKAIEKFNKAVDKTTEVTAKAFVKSGGYKHMNETDFRMFTAMLELMEASIELTTKQASMIDKINTKLDKLLAKQEDRA